MTDTAPTPEHIADVKHRLSLGDVYGLRKASKDAIALIESLAAQLAEARREIWGTDPLPAPGSGGLRHKLESALGDAFFQRWRAEQAEAVAAAARDRALEEAAVEADGWVGRAMLRAVMRRSNGGLLIGPEEMPMGEFSIMWRHLPNGGLEARLEDGNRRQ